MVNHPKSTGIAPTFLLRLQSQARGGGFPAATWVVGLGGLQQSSGRPSLEGQCLHVSLHLPPGDEIPWDSCGSLSQIPLHEHSSDAPLLSAVDPKAVSRLHSLFITASLLLVPHLFTKQCLCSQLMQAVGDPEANSSPWDRSVLPTHPCCGEVAAATGKSGDLQLHLPEDTSFLCGPHREPNVADNISAPPLSTPNKPAPVCGVDHLEL